MRRNSPPASSMATTKDHRLLHHQNSKRNFLLLPLLSLLCFASIFLALSLFRKASIPSHSRGIARFRSDPNAELQSCDFSDGTWIYDPDATPQRYDNTCKEIFKGWNCIAFNKSNARELIRWKWKPKQCDLHPFDPVRFLEKYRDTSIGFIGDSLNRNMFVSLFCTLKRVTSEVKKWRPAGSDRGFTFLHYNLTIAYHRTNLLARYGRWSANSNGAELESLGYKEGFRVDIDVAEGTWAEAPSFHDILIFNTGHWWWAPSKFDPLKSPMLFFENGHPVIPPLHPHEGLDKVLKHMVTHVEKTARPGAVKFFRTQSPRHFEGGDWDQGGSCQWLQPLLPEQVEELFSLKNNGTNVEARIVNQHLYKALEGSNFHILDITRMSELRADAHPSTAGGKKHDDCMHWCLPGVTDTWNDLFITHLNFKFGLFVFFVVFVVIMSIFVYFRLETKGIPIEEMSSGWNKHWYWSRFVDNDDDYAIAGLEMGKGNYCPKVCRIEAASIRLSTYSF